MTNTKRLLPIGVSDSVSAGAILCVVLCGGLIIVPIPFHDNLAWLSR